MAMIFGLMGRGFARFGASRVTGTAHPGANLLLRDGASNLLLRDGIAAILLGH